LFLFVCSGLIHLPAIETKGIEIVRRADGYIVKPILRGNRDYSGYVWNFFDEEKNYSVCKYCKLALKGRKTYSCKRHLESKHKITFELDEADS